MKKAVALFLSLTLVMTSLVACGNKDNTEKNDNNNTPKVEETTPTEEAKADDNATVTADAAKTGLAVINSIASSTEPGEKDGNAQVDTTVAAVLVDKDGKIVKAAIDMIQTKVAFNAEGKVLTDLSTSVQSKQQLKENYGMKKASGIQKEWYEQANAFTDYIVGKTVDEVKGIAVNEEFRPTDADLSASVTVHINGFIDVIAKAVANAQDLGATTSDKLGLGQETTIANSKDATADADGMAQAYSYYTVVTTDADGKITSCLIDASQAAVNFNAQGKITSDLATQQATKQELGEAYGMKAKSGIQKEWNEQANAFAQYVVGKTAADVKGIAVKDGYAAEADLTSSVTVHVTSFISTIDLAIANAK